MARPRKVSFWATKVNKNKEKIKHLSLRMRCVKKTLNYNGKKVKVYVIKDTIARASLFRIVVDDSFFSELSDKEQLAVLYHEKHHQKILTIVKRIINLFKFISFRKASWLEEFDADNHAKKKIGKKAVLSFLEKSRKRYQTGKTAYNPKTHPPIEERIKNVKKDD